MPIGECLLNNSFANLYWIIVFDRIIALGYNYFNYIFTWNDD